MTIRQLRYALAVSDTLSFTEAAERLHVSQPSLSQQIRALEEELGGSLFERRPGGPVRLTAAGQALISEARVAITSADRAAEAARQALRIKTHELGVATVRSLAASQHFPRAIEQWHAAHPGVAVRLHEFAHRREVEGAVRERIVEIGVGPRPADWEGATKSVGWDELVAVLPVGDPLLHAPGHISLQALSDRDWVLFEPDYGLAEPVIEACAAEGFKPRPFVHTVQVEAAARLAAAGIGPTLVPRNAVPGDVTQMTRRLDPPVVWQLVAFSADPTWTDTAADFLQVLLDIDWPRTKPANARVLQR
jgi:DNA-binding transcriptional LysR family regulator